MNEINEEYENEKYEAFLDKGRLKALDKDTGHIYFIEINGRRIFSSLIDEDCPYEIFEQEDKLYCFNTMTANIYEIELIKIEENV